MVNNMVNDINNMANNMVIVVESLMVISSCCDVNYNYTYLSGNNCINHVSLWLAASFPCR